jgi:hypothetical protein
MSIKVRRHVGKFLQEGVSILKEPENEMQLEICTVLAVSGVLSSIS